MKVLINGVEVPPNLVQYDKESGQIMIHQDFAIPKGPLTITFGKLFTGLVWSDGVLRELPPEFDEETRLHMDRTGL